MVIQDFTTKTKELIDNLKGICAAYGLGNDGNEFKIITQVFLYKFLNDKFAREIKLFDKKFNTQDWEKLIENYSDEEYEMLVLQMSADTAKLKREHYLTYLYHRQNVEQFAKLFDDTLRDIAIYNADVFAVKTGSGTKITLFDELSQFITDSPQRDNFCKALVSKLFDFSFEGVFEQKFDFFSTIFEYLIKDYNKDGGGKYAEYYTPHAVANIMAKILADEGVKSVTCYDPAAGSGTLLMSLAHTIGENKCSIYSQDISQKSSGMLRLNLILNNLVHSIPNIIQGNTLKEPYHKEKNSLLLRKFDYIVSNPPFKLDFSDYYNDLDNKQNNERFFAGIPNIPNKDKDKMSIYLLFIQHIIFSLAPKGKAAIVVPTGFITAQSGIEKKIRQQIVAQKMLKAVVSMPSNIFATTGTNVSVLFLDKENTDGNIILLDASKLGKTVKEGKNQKTVLSEEEENKIIQTVRQKKQIEDFSVVLNYEQIIEKNYSFSAGQYFEVKIDYTDISEDDFKQQLTSFSQHLDLLFAESRNLEAEIKKQLTTLKFD